MAVVQGVTDRLRPTMGKRKRGGIQGGVVASVIGAMAAATLYLSTNQFNHHMNPVGGTKTPFYDAMIEALSTETDYSLLAHEPVDNNPILYQTLKSFTLSQTHVNKPKAEQALLKNAKCVNIRARLRGARVPPPAPPLFWFIFGVVFQRPFHSKRF